MRAISTLTLGVLTALTVAASDGAGPDPAATPAHATGPETASDQGSSTPSQAGAIDLGYTRGPEQAPIAVVEFSDFGCPYCARFARTTFPALNDEYIDEGTIRWRFVPVVFGFPGGELMGSAAVCAAQLEGEDMFWRVHDLLYTRQQALRGDGARPVLLDWIAGLGVDRAALDTCIDAPSTAALLRRHTNAAREWYVRGTPTFLVNGVPMAGAAPTAFFRKVFDTVLDPSGL
jgi:protein-disulfide isomerase